MSLACRAVCISTILKALARSASPTSEGLARWQPETTTDAVKGTINFARLETYARLALDRRGLRDSNDGAGDRALRSACS